MALNTDDGPIAVMFLEPIAFLTAEEEDVQAGHAGRSHRAAGRPRRHHAFRASPVEIGGLSGLEVDAAFEIDNTHVIRVSAGNIGFGPTADVRLAVLEADEGLLVIGLNAPVGHMDDAEELTQSVRDSITIHCSPGLDR